MRRALTPLKEMAEETGAAALLNRHLNKSGDLKAEYRGGGSIGFTPLARSALVSEAHPTDDGVMVLAQIKSNLAVRSRAITYQIESTAIATDEDDVIEVPMIKFGQEIDITC